MGLVVLDDFFQKLPQRDVTHTFKFTLPVKLVWRKRVEQRNIRFAEGAKAIQRRSEIMAQAGLR